MESLRRRVEGFVEALAGSRYRRLAYITPGRLETLGWMAGKLAELRPGARILMAYRQPGDPLVQKIREALAGAGGLELGELVYQESERVLGTTWDGLVADITLQLKPNDLGILVELVRGGGLVVLVGPGVDEVGEWITDFHRELAAYPYTVRDVSKRFERRLLAKTVGRAGTLYIDRGRSVFGPEPPSPPPPSGPGMPGDVFPRELYEMCLTLDEARVLRALEGFMERGRRSLVITANRGRGKSAALGLGIAGLITVSRRRRVREVVITAPEPLGVQTLFEFVSQGVRRLGYEPEVEERSGAILGLRVKGAQVYYRSPYAVTRLEGEMAVVDEASGVPVPVLFAIRRRFRKTVYSATIHGYEGAGRGFNVRFLGRVRREERRGGLMELEMTEPVRYAAGDPVERWLYDALLLDAEPAQISEEERDEAVESARYLKVDLEEWFSSSEELLRQFVGIYVLTHYRNRPDDLALLGDAPHHRARAFITSGGKVAAALQLCYEGGLPREVVSEMVRVQPRGHMIPSVIARYYPHLKRFGTLRGARIVRVAVHPELWGRGLGSRMLRMVEEELDGQVDWVGSGFGASPELLRFWCRNGFAPIHVGPVRNPVSGEFSVIVVKPFSRRAEEILSEVSREFRLRFLECLPDPYFNMERDVSWLLLSRTIGEHKAKAEFKGSQRLRLQSYLEYAVTYEGASDAIKALAKAHFLTSAERRVGIGEKAEKLLIMKVLQGRPWGNVAGQLNEKSGELRELMRELAEKLLKYYG